MSEGDQCFTIHFWIVLQLKVTLLLNFLFKTRFKYFHEDEKYILTVLLLTTAVVCCDFLFSLVKQLLAFNLPLFFSADEALLEGSNPQTTRLLMLVFPW